MAIRVVEVDRSHGKPPKHAGYVRCLPEKIAQLDSSLLHPSYRTAQICEVNFEGEMLGDNLAPGVSLRDPRRLYPKQFDSSKLIELVGNSDTVQELQAGEAPEKIVTSWSSGLATFDQTRRKYFLYK